MINKFLSYPIPPILSGVEVIYEIGNQIINFDSNCKRILIFLSPDIEKLPHIKKIKSALRNYKIDFYSKIDREPTVDDVSNAITFASSFKPDTIIGIGGGSVLDLSKFVAVAIANKNLSMEKIIARGEIKRQGVKLILVPSTAGTGSELTPIAVVFRSGEHLKMGVVNPYFIPDLVILDPVLTTSLPPIITAYTGVDALAHAIEAYFSKKSTAFTDLFALEAIRTIFLYLEKAVNDGKDLESRQAMLEASDLAGIALANAGVGAVHAMSYPLGGSYKISHGVSVGLLLTEVLKFNLPACESKIPRLAQYIGLKSPASKNLILAIDSLLGKINLPRSLKDLNVKKNNFTAMSKSAISIKRLMVNNPRKMTVGDALQIYNKIY